MVFTKQSTAMARMTETYTIIRITWRFWKLVLWASACSCRKVTPSTTLNSASARYSPKYRRFVALNSYFSNCFSI